MSITRPLPKKQIARIELALRNAERALKYIERTDIAICRADSPATTTLHYRRDDGSTMYPLTKDIGSDITGLGSCIQELRNIIADHSEAKLRKMLHD